MHMHYNVNGISIRSPEIKLNKIKIIKICRHRMLKFK